MCLEVGTYYLNFKQCAGCGAGMAAVVSSRPTTTGSGEGDDAETVTYRHTCKACSHVIAEHFYSFTVEDGALYQEHLMDCVLCGRGAASVSIDPVDPRRVRGLA